MSTERITIRRSPAVLIRNLALIELVAFILYVVAVTLGNSKYELYLQIPLLPDIFPYQALKIFALSGIQFVITIYAFLSWYYEHYVVIPTMISHERGIFFKQSTNVPFRETMSVTLVEGPIRKLLHCGSLIIHNSSLPILTLTDISYPKKYLDIILTRLNGSHAYTIEPSSQRVGIAEDILQYEEHSKLEFKSSLRFDHHTKKVNRELEKVTMKTVAAFLNSDGGRLVIGVGDDKSPLGLHHDYQTLGRQSADGFENHFTQLFNKMLGPDIRHLAQLTFHKVQDKDICMVDISPSPRPVYLATENDEFFYVRTGNISTPLKLSEVESYARERWPHAMTG
ncbi:MAG: putative DNA binding domain-containing protein [Patescibacteria group bacterium]|nr:putative DNA binding domain-containing protein [Patescibacteria group bacterium]